MKKGHKEQNIWLLACLSGLVAVVAALLLSMLTAKLLESGTIPMTAMELTSLVILGISSAVSAVLTAVKGKRKILILCIITATIFFLSIAILNGILQRGQFCRIGETALVIYAVTVLTGLLCARKKQRYR